MTGDALTAAVGAHHRGDTAAFEASLDRFITTSPDEVTTILVTRLTVALAAAWARGWQPADVVRSVGRAHGAHHARLMAEAVARQHAGYSPTEMDDRWAAQIRALGARGSSTATDSYLDRLGVDRILALRYGVEALATLEALPSLPQLIPPPGTAPRARSRTPRRAGRDAASRMLDRVRALLAKAESSQYAEEAEAFTTKAQELTVRHSIDVALLESHGDGREQPTAVRMAVDSPYEEAKALLLQNVAEANLSRSVWSAELGFATVFGFPDDLDSIELIYTSLLVQGTAAMVREGSGKRARSFRQAFLYAYATRLGQRLRSTSDNARAGSPDDLLPVLASREAAVQDKVSEVFAEFTTRRTRITDERGWLSGTAAADRIPLP